MDIQAIDALDTQQQRELYDLLAFRLKNTKVAYTAAEVELWDAVGTALDKSAKERRPLALFVAGNGGTGGFGRARYADAVSTLNAVLDRALPEVTRKPVRMQVRTLMLRSLARYLTAMNVPTTEKSLLNNLGILEHAVDQTYPGYIAARLLHRIALQGVH